MRRRDFISSVGAMAVWPLTASATQPKPKVIGFLFGRSETKVLVPFEGAMKSLGYIQGKDYLIESRSADNQFARLPGLADELVELKVDVIVTTASPGIRAAQRATSTIPIVMGNTGDAVGSGFVASLARPGGNITGLTNLTPEISTKHLELLREVVPGLLRVAILANPASSTRVHTVTNTQNAGQKFGLEVVALDAGSIDEIERCFATLSQEHLQALIIASDLFINGRFDQIAQLSLKNRIASVQEFRGYPEIGGLMSYGPNVEDNFRRAAGFVDRIFKGAKPADIPVEQPTKFELVINLKTAKALGLTVPATLLATADDVIE
jgi:putative tryptophan/tyrosine transport system substrate-binding protein